MLNDALCNNYIWRFNYMKLQEIIENCRTVHHYQDRQVSKQLVEKALENSLTAPNHRFTFPWKYYWAGDEVKSQLVDLAIQVKSMKAGELSEQEKEGIRNKFNHPEIIAFVQKRNDDEFTSKEDYATLSCSVQLFALTLAEQGVGYKWGTGKITRHPETYRFFGIDQEKEEIIGFIMAGYPLNEAKERNRPPLGEILVRCK
jgi:nitroreductase